MQESIGRALGSGGRAWESGREKGAGSAWIAKGSNKGARMLRICEVRKIINSVGAKNYMRGVMEKDQIAKRLKAVVLKKCFSTFINLFDRNLYTQTEF